MFLDYRWRPQILLAIGSADSARRWTGPNRHWLSGCSVAAIKKIESDERRPSLQIAERLADVLGVPANQREMFLEVARGVRSVDQLSLARERAVPSLPSGIVTFLFTDIEDSKRDVELPAESVIAISQFLLDLKLITK